MWARGVSRLRELGGPATQSLGEVLWQTGRNVLAQSRNKVILPAVGSVFCLRHYATNPPVATQGVEQVAMVKPGGGPPSGRRKATSHDVDNLYAGPHLSKDKLLELLTYRIERGSDLSDASFENFPYHLEPTVREQLTLCTGMHLLSPAPALSNAFGGIFHFQQVTQEVCPLHYQETLARGLAHHYNAAFISLDRWDVTMPLRHDSRLKQETEGGRRQESAGRKKARQPAMPEPSGTKEVPCPTDVEAALSLVFEAADKVLPTSPHPVPLLLFVRGLGEMVPYLSVLRAQMAKARSQGRPVALIGTMQHNFETPYMTMHMQFNPPSDVDEGFSDEEDEDSIEDEGHSMGQGAQYGRAYGWRGNNGYALSHPSSESTSILIPPPTDPQTKAKWLQQMKDNQHIMVIRDNHRQLANVIFSSNLMHAPLGSVVGLERRLIQPNEAKKILACAVSSAMQRLPPSAYTGGAQLQLEAQDVQRALDVFRGPHEQFLKVATPTPGNSYESKLLPNLLTPGKLPFRFDDIGALDKVKESLRELISLPLQRPSLFNDGVLAKSVSGILLFGPPGTGKTMLGKAVAAESGSNFLHVSMSDIMDMYVGQGEKNAKAVFTLARKHSPCVVFLDEVDSLLARRGQHHYTTKAEVLNEFMAEWDGLKTDNARVIVLAATNRPFDLDDAVLRRLPRRLMVDLPDQTARQRILEVILRKEKLASDLSMSELAAITKDYSGSDLNNLCMAAALRSVKEALSQEAQTGQEAKERSPLSMHHFKQALGDVKSSASEDMESVVRLHDWNARYGIGGRPRRTTIGFGSTK